MGSPKPGTETQTTGKIETEDRSKDENKAYQEKFNSYSNPRFFLVDKNGILLSRSGNTNELFRIINQK